MFVAGSVLLVLLTIACLHLDFTRAGTELVFLVIVVFVSVYGGFVAGACTSIVAVAALAYFLAPVSRGGFHLSDPVNAIEAVVFIASAFVISRLVTNARQREKDVRLVMNAVPALIVVVGSAEGSSDWFTNRRFTDYTGLTIKEVRERGWESTFHPDDVATFAADRKAVFGGQKVEREARLRDAHGEYRWFLNRVVPMRDESDRVTRQCVIAVDIDDRKHAEETLRHSREDLARVSRVTAMGELVASIAHEVNQPLAAVVTNANAALRWLAAEPPNLDEVRDATRRIVDDGNRASNVVGRIRAILAKKEPAKERINVDEVIAEVVALTKGEAQRTGTSVHLELSSAPDVVMADRVQLQQVLMNLMLNGMEAMHSVKGRSRTLTIQSRRHEGEGVYVAVRDSGVGISEEHLAHIFDAFYTTKSGGLGMGLAIGRSIIEAHGGRIWATSERDRGSTIQFTLPAIKDDAA